MGRFIGRRFAPKSVATSSKKSWELFFADETRQISKVAIEFESELRIGSSEFDIGAKEGQRKGETEYRLTNHLPRPVSCPKWKCLLCPCPRKYFLGLPSFDARDRCCPKLRADGTRKCEVCPRNVPTMPGDNWGWRWVKPLCNVFRGLFWLFESWVSQIPIAMILKFE